MTQSLTGRSPDLQLSLIAGARLADTFSLLENPQHSMGRLQVSPREIGTHTSEL